MKSKLYTMRMRLIVFCLLAMGTLAQAQMDVNGKMLFGNEWIDYDRTYWKAYVAEDGMYKMTVAELKSAGIPVESTPLSRLEVNYFGETLPVFTSTDGIGSDDDYILFYGQKNRGQLDEYMKGPEETLLNPEYSLINDTSAYFLSIAPRDVVNRITEKRANLTGNTLTPEPYYLHTEEKVFKSKYYKPTINGYDVRYSWVVSSEGYGSKLQSNNTFELEANNIYSSGPEGKLEVQYGGNRTPHLFKTFFNGIEIDSNLISDANDFNQVTNLQKEISLSELTKNNKVEVKSLLTDNSDKNIISYGKLTYAHTFDMENKSYVELDLVGSNTPRYLEISNWGGEDLSIYDRSTKTLYKPINEGGVWKVILPPSSDVVSKGAIFFSDESNVDVDRLQRKFVDYTLFDHDYVLLTSKTLRNDGEGNDYVQEYADYKSSTIGGGYNPIIVNIDELYDQYGYGVKRHVMGVRNFNQFVKSKWTDYKFLFIVGHGLEYDLVRSSAKLAQHNTLMHVPTFGKPGSDMLMSADRDSKAPIVGYGRIAASSVDDIKVYLEKVREFDFAKNADQDIDKLWLKNIMHLSGGSSDIQATIARNLNIMKDTIENNLYGGNVSTFYKKTSSAVQIALSEQIFNKINEGTSILTFFGHSAVGTFDFSLDDVRNYENKGKYPVLFSLGCYSGNIHTTAGISISKQFVLTPERGSINFIASTGSSYLSQQYFFARDFYDLLGGEMYGKELSLISKDLLTKSKATSSSAITFYQQLAYHGDPSLIVSNFEKADVLLDGATSELKPEVVDSYQDDFEFCIDVVNIGRIVEDSVNVKIQHYSPEQKLVLDTIMKINVPRYRENVCFKLPIEDRNLLGENTLKLEVNYDQKVEEGPSSGAIDNNKLVFEGVEGFKFYVLSNSAKPVFPQNYGIVGTSKVNLMSSTYNAMAPKQKYLLQVDTTNSFNSDYLKTYTLEGRGLLSKEYTIDLSPETVIYWRIGQDTTGNGLKAVVWNASSFVYVPEVNSGWNHSHFNQFEDDELNNMEWAGRKLKYIKDLREIKFYVNHPVWGGAIFNNGDWIDYLRRHIPAGVTVSVFDPLTSKAWFKKGDEYGSANLTKGPDHTFYYEYDAKSTESASSLKKFLTEVIPDGYPVAVSFFKGGSRGYGIELWRNQESSFLNVLKEEGAALIDSLSNDGLTPYMFSYIKGEDTKVFAEAYETEPGEGIDQKFEIDGIWNEGDLTTTLIGPATSYNRLEWDYIEEELTESDTIKISVIGITKNKEEVDLVSSNRDKSIDLSSINAEVYPNIKIRFDSRDNENLTAVQISKIRVLYKESPDIALMFDTNIDSLYQEGQDIVLTPKYFNTTAEEMPPFEVEVSHISAQNVQASAKYQVGKISAGSSVSAKHIVKTKGLDGSYSLQLVANPLRNPNEMHYFNNVAVTGFSIKQDEIDPVVEVRFDGKEIFDNDIVSASPTIVVQLKDENPFLKLVDSSIIVAKIQFPDGSIQEFKAMDDQVRFIPAKDNNNTASLEFTPQLSVDGTYILDVIAYDESKNLAGQSSYSIAFQVINEETIRNVLNYPNPFSTSTQFFFTLTGASAPDNMVIRIMTVSGKVVKEIDMSEIGNVAIGNNMSDYKWDGTDEYGNRLGNGVYLYQVVTKNSEGNSFKEVENSNAGNFFKDGFGKLVILR